MKPEVGKLVDKIWVLWNSNSNKWFSKPCINLSTWASKMQLSYKTKHNSRNNRLWWSNRCQRNNQLLSAMSASVIRARISMLQILTYSRASSSKCKLSSKLCKQLSNSSPLDKFHNLWLSLSLSCINHSHKKTLSSRPKIISTSRILRILLLYKTKREQLLGSSHSILSSIKRLHHQLIWTSACSNISKLWCPWLRLITAA